MVKWLERLSYGEESCRKVVSSRLGFVMRQWKTLSVNPAVNGTFFESGNDKAAKREGLAPPFIRCAQDTVGH